MNKVKISYYFIALIIFTLLITLISFTGFPSPIKYHKINDFEYSKNFNSQTLNSIYYFPQGQITYQDTVYTLIRATGKVKKGIYSQSGIKPVDEYDFAPLTVGHSIYLKTEDDILPAFYLYQDEDEIRSEYVYIPQLNKKIFLYSYNYKNRSYNLDNNGVILDYPVGGIIFQNKFYYLVLRYEFEMDKPDRGLWCIDLESGEKKQLLATASFVNKINYFYYDDSPLLHVLSYETNNGAVYENSADSIAYLHTWNLSNDSLLYVHEINNPTQIAFSHNNFNFNNKKISIDYLLQKDGSKKLISFEDIDPFSGEILCSGYQKDYRENILDRLDTKNKISMGYNSRYVNSSAIKNMKLNTEGLSDFLNKFRYTEGFYYKQKVIIADFVRDEEGSHIYLRDQDGRVYTVIDDTELIADGGFKNVIGYSLNFSDLDGAWLLSLEMQDYNNWYIRSIVLQARTAFKTVSLLYNISLVLVKYRILVIILASIILLFLIPLLLLFVYPNYRSMKDLSCFLTSPDLIFLNREGIQNILEPKVEASAILIIRVINMNEILANTKNHHDESKILNAILTKIANCSFKENIIIDKYLNEGIMLVQRRLDREKMIENYLQISNDLINDLNDFKYRGKRLNINLCFGLSYGPSLIGLFGNKYRKDFTAIGKFVNMAFRLSVKAEAKQILCNKAAIENIPGLKAKEKELVLKGFEEETNYKVIEL